MTATATDTRPAEVLRVTGPDESYLLVAELFGMGAPIQITWVFDDDPGDAAIESLCAGLAAGPLHRAVSRRRVPFARHRWVRSTMPVRPGPVAVVEADAVGEWADAVLRASRLDPVRGTGWQLDSARIRGGGRAVSLLASHMITDGHGLYRLVADAAAGRTAGLPAPVSGHSWEAVRADAADAAESVRAAARSARILIREARAARGTDTGSADTRSAPGSSRTTRPARPRSAPEPDTTLATVDVSATEWAARATEHGGTGNSLFTALLAGVVHRSGRPLDGPMKVCIAVSKRDGDDDNRANASGGVWIRLADPVEPDTDLTAIRSSSKRAFVDYAESGADQAADNLQPIVRILPRRLIGRLMRGIPGPDTTVSNLGATPDSAMRIGGHTASRFAIRAVMQGMPAQERRERGPAVAAWAVTYGDTVTLTFFGIDPDDFGDPVRLRTLIADELTAWRIGHRFW
ncbi:hypothetical protein [Gordonia sp. UCD-TK1]|uniref:hypothetical protein n=1 Tax=Gordonia sp. UCD-TK1 TaxID=1857893 RepID=UPI00080EB786|nr:hypothetical protein [Gordonia sp. UCD-TK1]OCH78853.1 hypothetical protein A9310_10700 [Gordonia sp. UCD-TK1]